MPSFNTAFRPSFYGSQTGFKTFKQFKPFKTFGTIGTF